MKARKAVLPPEGEPPPHPEGLLRTSKGGGWRRSSLFARAFKTQRVIEILEWAIEIAAAALVLLYVADRAVLRLVDPTPPFVPLGSSAGGSRRLMAGKIPVLVLTGPAAQRGYDLAKLAESDLVRFDTHMFALFGDLVPFAPARLVIERIARVRYRGVANRLPEEMREEIAGLSAGYHDPFASRYPTYPRQVFYHAVYDVALSFERSPLIGCTAFAASGWATAGGHTLAGRNFDSEAGEIFDTGKCVTVLVPPAGRGIPFASVAWPGMLGVVTGLNLEGIWVEVNGARSGESSAEGVPVIVALREVLEGAHDLAEAIEILRAAPAMIGHIVLVADGETGEIAIVERDPRHFEVRRAEGGPRGGGLAWVANHFHTPDLAASPGNRRIERTTSTLAREARMEELVRGKAGGIDAAAAMEMLRDRRGKGGVDLPPGDRRAIDASIATHSVVADATARTLYVAEGPHAEGAVQAIDLEALVREAQGDQSAARRFVTREP